MREGMLVQKAAWEKANPDGPPARPGEEDSAGMMDSLVEKMRALSASGSERLRAMSGQQ